MPAEIAPGHMAVLEPPERLCGMDARQWTIRRQIMTGILLVAAAVLVAVTTSSVVNVFVLGGATESKAIDSLEGQIRVNALNFSITNGQYTKQFLLRRAAMANLLAVTVSQLLSADPWLQVNSTVPSLWFEDVCDAPGAVHKSAEVCTTRYQSNYYLPKTRRVTSGVTCGINPDDSHPQLGYDMRVGTCVSLSDRLGETCPCPCISGCGEPTIVDAARRERDVSVHLDRHFMGFAKSLSDVNLMYIGFEATGLFRQYPAANDLPAEMTYDPRKRPWYTSAREAPQEVSETGHNVGKTIVSAPYAGASTGVMMVTIAKAVYDHEDSRKLLCVIGLDLTLEDIQENIQERVHFLETGYVALVESSSREEDNANARIVVAHKTYADSAKYEQIMRGRDEPVLDISDVEPQLLLETDIFRDIWTSNGIKDYERDGKRYLLAHSSITEPAGYTVLIFIPSQEALAAVPTMTESIHATELEVTVTVLLMSLLTGTVVFVVVAAISRHISAPVASMVTVANAIVGGAAEQNFGKNVTAAHMARLHAFAYPDDPEGKAAAGDGDVRNEMVMLSRSFLQMTQGLQQDTNRSKQRVIQPENAYHAAREHPVVTLLNDIDTSRWRAPRTVPTAAAVPPPLATAVVPPAAAAASAIAPPVAAVVAPLVQTEKALASAGPTAPPMGRGQGRAPDFVI